ncbi:thioredoxin domain-containing protein [Candidatus Nomurabacteria bacterium]|jgi:protein-disulfide isomerase|nr:thioredoxin domain-containing protein [Candidatus Saccharibacteria bacterium]MCB9839459.1 thioredoxin domain-containing protein [Candidatus Nomurabacteria bacterium]
MDKKFLVILSVVLVALFGLFFFTSSKNEDTSQNQNSSEASVSNHSKGGNSKDVEIVAYSDFQCPVCAQFFPIESQVTEKYKDQIKFTFRHFPLDTIHPNARAAHRAAEAAGKQNKFFEMHDLIYQNHSAWETSQNAKTFFDEYAKSLGLNMDQFNKDYSSEIVNSTINADKQEGTKRGVQGTPTYYINGDKIENTDISSVESFSAVIEKYINKQN